MTAQDTDQKVSAFLNNYVPYLLREQALKELEEMLNMPPWQTVIPGSYASGISGNPPARREGL